MLAETGRDCFAKNYTFFPLKKHGNTCFLFVLFVLYYLDLRLMCKKTVRTKVHRLSAREDSSDLGVQWILGTLERVCVCVCVCLCVCVCVSLCVCFEKTFDGGKNSARQTSRSKPAIMSHLPQQT